MNRKIIWVGIRESDIDDTGKMFFGSITVFGYGRGNNKAMERLTGIRPDYGSDVFAQPYTNFVEEQMRLFLKSEPDCVFFQYCALDGMDIPDDLQRHLVFKSDYDILNLIENKIYMKLWINQCAQILPYITIIGSEFSHSRFLESFPNDNRFVVQGINSFGGENTFFVTEKNEKTVRQHINPNAIYSVSPYLQNSIPINIHVVVYEKDIVLFPPSVQIIGQDYSLKYHGCDYTAYKLFCNEQHDEVCRLARQIGQKLQSIGYCGAFGIDLLITEKDIYYMEINPRFQASTFLLNKRLTANGCQSIMHYHIDAFENRTNSIGQPLALIDGSFYNFTYSQEKVMELKWLYNQLGHVADEKLYKIDDGLCWDKQFEQSTYLFRVVYGNNITYVDKENQLRLHENFTLTVPPQARYDKPSLIRLKIMLLCRGTRISDEAKKYLAKSNGMDYEEFYAINIRLYNKIWISVPAWTPMHLISPFSIEYGSGQGLSLSFYGTPLLPISVQPRDMLADEITSKNHRFSDIAYLGTDRLRIFHRNACFYRQNGNACLFCDLIGCEEPFGLDEIFEVIDTYFDQKSDVITHCLIGGGSAPIEKGFERISLIAGYIKNKFHVPIYLMCLPVNCTDTMKKLRAAGVTEITFNLEIADRNYARKIMPGKGQISYQYYYESLVNAVSVWQEPGAVRSILLLGIDTEPELLHVTSELCKIGVSPILSLVQPIDEGLFEHYIGPDENSVINLYWQAESICEQHGLSLGPTCPDCQNNTLQVTL